MNERDVCLCIQYAPWTINILTLFTHYQRLLCLLLTLSSSFIIRHYFLSFSLLFYITTTHCRRSALL